jgi:hypothetical protein
MAVPHVAGTWLVHMSKYICKMLTVVVMQHRIKCDQVWISKIMTVIYLVLTTGIRIQRLNKKM